MNVKKLFLLTLILLLAAILRFQKLDQVVMFEYDEQYHSNLVFNLVKNKHVSLIGQEMSFGGMFLGPWHYLYLTPFYLLTNLHPIGGYVGEAVLSLFIVLSYFFIGERLFSTRVGLLASFFRAILVSLIKQDWTIGPAYPSELVALWFVYFLVRLSQGSSFSLPLLAFLFGMMFTVHLVILPLAIVLFILIVVSKPIKIDIRLILRSGLLFILPITPQVLFEIRHNFSHINRLISSFLPEHVTEINITRKLWYVISFNIGNLYSLFDTLFLPSTTGAIIFLLLIFLIYRKVGEFSARHHSWLFLLTFTVVIIYYLVYPRHVPEYYFLALTPIIILYISGLLVTIWNYKLGQLITLIFISLTLVSNSIALDNIYNNPAGFSLREKDLTVKAIIDHQKGNKDFSISYFIEYGRHYGFQYFFKYYGLEPRNDVKPPIYSIVLPRSQVAEKDLSLTFGSIGVIFPEKESQQW